VLSNIVKKAQDRRAVEKPRTGECRMEKLVFVFRRKAGLSRAEFHEHYVQNHSPLGLRLQANLSGYTVNHLLSDAEFDTVTEIWTPSARAFTGGGAQTTLASEEIVADHVSFMGPQDKGGPKAHARPAVCAALRRPRGSWIGDESWCTALA
jgi:hypothetical protein